MARYRTTSRKTDITDVEAVEDLVQEYTITLDIYIDNGRIGITGDGEFKVFEEAPVVPGQGDDVTPQFLNELRQYIPDGSQFVINEVDTERSESIRYIVMPGTVQKWEPDGTAIDLTE